MFKPSNKITWRLQYERVHRSFARLIGPHTSFTDYEDDVYYFFQDCWHLVDWIGRDPGTGVTFDVVKREAEKETALRITADLANGAKHFVRTKQTYVGAHASGYDIAIGSGPVQAVFTITHGSGTTQTAEQLADEAVDAWERVLAILGLSK